MSEYIWVKDCGIITAEVLLTKLQGYEGDFFYACHTGSKIKILDYNDINDIDINTLLEIRAFNSQSELYAYRFALDECFNYRIADDGNLPCENYSAEFQLLSIDSGRKATAENGNSKLFAVGGGDYEVTNTLNNPQKVKIINYIYYDGETGRAIVSDFRIGGIE